MEWGNLETELSPGLFYMPVGSKRNAIYTSENVKKQGGIVLDGPHVTRFNHTKVPCGICKKCRKIIIPYN
jgi:hypothetical protein